MKRRGGKGREGKKGMDRREREGNGKKGKGE